MTPNTRYMIVARDGSFLPNPGRRVDFDDLDTARAHLASFHNPSKFRIAVVTYLD